MIVTRLLALILMTCLAVTGPRSWAADASTWVEGRGSRVRLIAGDAEPRERWAGVEIALDPGFKTYWRTPGESGLPPVFDWSRSTNVAAVEPLWPAPSRFEDGGGVAYGYSGGVVLPVRVTPREPDKLVRLALALEYGVCKDLCIPAQADLSLDLPERAQPASSGLIRQARERVPKPQALGAEGDLAVLDVAPAPEGGKPRITVRVRAPAGAAPRLFVEGPDDWFFAAAEAMDPAVPSSGSAQGTFRVEVDPPPGGARTPVPLRLTLVAGDRAIETTASLDGTLSSR
jgi:DsbC/DsbD-like thiol-disulfide interchange protein